MNTSPHNANASCIFSTFSYIKLERVIPATSARALHVRRPLSKSWRPARSFLKLNSIVDSSTLYVIQAAAPALLSEHTHYPSPAFLSVLDLIEHDYDYDYDYDYDHDHDHYSRIEIEIESSFDAPRDVKISDRHILSLDRILQY
jgi:hypothetical protein